MTPMPKWNACNVCATGIFLKVVLAPGCAKWAMGRRFNFTEIVVTISVISPKKDLLTISKSEINRNGQLAPESQNPLKD